MLALGFGFGCNRRGRPWGGTPTPTPDVTTLADIQAIVNGTNPKTPGSTVYVAPGNYDTRALTFTSAPGVSWKGSNPNNPPVFTGWKIDPASHAAEANLAFEDIDFNKPLSTDLASPFSPLPATLHAIVLGSGASLGSLAFRRVRVFGNMAPFRDGGRMTESNPLVYLRGSKNLLVEDCLIANNQLGIALDGQNGALIQRTTFTGQHGDPIGYYNAAGHCQDIIFRDNVQLDPAGDTSNFHWDGTQLNPTDGPYKIRRIAHIGNLASAISPVVFSQVDPTTAGRQSLFPDIRTITAAAGNTTATLPTAQANGTNYIYLRTDSSGNTCEILPGAGDTLSSGASQALTQNNMTVFVYNSTTKVWAVEVTGLTSGQFMATRQHAHEIRWNLGANAAHTVALPSAAAGRVQICIRVTGAGAGSSLTVAPNGADTFDLDPRATTTMSAVGQFVTLVSDGVDKWKSLPQGFRNWFIPREASFTLGAYEAGKVTKVDATAADVVMTLPAGGSGEFPVQRIDGTPGRVVKIVAPAGQSIVLNGSTVTEINFTQGYGGTITGVGGVWTMVSGTPTAAFLFGNRGDYEDLTVAGNIICVYGDAVRMEVSMRQMIYNNTIIPPLFDDLNGDGFVDRYENNSGTANQIQLSGVQALAERNLSAGYIGKGGYPTATEGPAEIGSEKNNVMLAISDWSSFPAALTTYFNGTAKADYRPTTREAIIAMARQKAGSPALAEFQGACGTNDTDGYYNFSTRSINTSILPAPLLTETSPASGATVGLGQAFTVSFDQFIVAGTGNVTLYNATDGATTETFDVATGAGSAGGTIAFTLDGFTVTPNSDLVDGKTYHLRIANTCVVSRAYAKAYAGVSDGTYSYTADAGISSAFIPLLADNGAYLTRTGTWHASATVRKALFGFEARLIPNANAIHSIFAIDRTTDFNAAIVRSSGELRMTYGAAAWRVASAVPVSGTALNRILMTVDTTQATIGDGVKVYVNGVLATLTNTAWTQNTALVGTDAATVIKAMLGMNSVFNGEAAFVYFDSPAVLPDLSDSAERAKFDPGAIGADGSGPTGSVPLFYKTGDQAAWETATNLGSLSGFSKVGSFL